MKTIAVIGTAGRDKNKPWSEELLHSMFVDARTRFGNPEDYTLVSGGAAWADHLAVMLFLGGHVKRLILHLPAPLTESMDAFLGGYGTAGGAANYYHEQFTHHTGVNGIAEIQQAISDCENCFITTQPVAKGMGAFFARNKLVAQDAKDGVLAYTWGEGPEPADGGTKNTWDQVQARKVHVPLSRFI